MLESWLRVIVALGAIGLWSLDGADVRAEEAASQAPQASDSVAGCQDDGKPCCVACQKRAELIGADKAAAAPCPCQRAKAAREAAEAEQ